MRQIRLDRRALSAALTVGIAIGFAQMVPLMLLPIVFEYPLRYGTWWAVGAIAPFVIALLLAGPVSGVLLRRFGPRGILSVGTLAIGLANVLLALIIWGINGWVRDYFTADPGAARPVLDPLHYLLFIVPMIMIGAGFVVATVVRTAVVFATTPRGLPGSAAAINEASVVLGSRIGIVVATTALAAAAIGSFRTMAERARSTEAEVTALVGEFELMLRSLGTPRFRDAYGATLEGSDTLKGAAYMVAYLDGVTVALIVSALVAILGAVLAWILVGRRGPIETVFDMQDERPHPAEPAPADR
jgi:MFS family permease